VHDARLVMEVGGVTSIHDPTEGGLVTALWELAEASQMRIEVDLYGDP
jgi:hydrogenase maturation factor